MANVNVDGAGGRWRMAAWDRLPLLTDEITPAVYRAIGAKCEELRAEVIAIGGVEDHIHLLVKLPATITVADLVKQIKGATSHLANFQLPDGGSFRWQGSYAAFSVESERIPTLVKYIAHQRTHHLSNTTVPTWETSAQDHARNPAHVNESPPHPKRT